MTKKTPEKVQGDEEQDLAATIAAISDGMKKLLASGLNRKAVIVLLRDATGVGKRQIEQVLDGLTTLAKKYTTAKTR